MKKLIAGVLVLILCFALFAGCAEEKPTPTEPAVSGLDNAKAYLRTMYKDAAEQVRFDFDRVSVVMINNVSYNITWTVNVAEDLVKIVPGDKIVTVDINEEPTEQVNFTLTATLTDAEGKTTTVEFKHFIEAVEPTGTVFVDAPVAGTAYKFALEQNNRGETLYFTGAMNGYYLATSNSPVDAVDTYLEEVEGGLRLYFLDGETKTYVEIYDRGEGKAGVQLSTEPTTVYTYDALRKTLVATFGENSFYMGCYSDYNTMSASNTSYIEDTSKIGVSQFPAGFCTVTLTIKVESAPVAETAYKFGLEQNNRGEVLYFTGAMNGYYLATSTSTADAVDVYLEEVEGGLRLYFLDGETKTYVEIYDRGEGKAGVQLSTEPTTTYTFDAERKTLVATFGENSFYMGCYSDYNTMSASNTSYIEDTSKIGVSQFPAGLISFE